MEKSSSKKTKKNAKKKAKHPWIKWVLLGIGAALIVSAAAVYILGATLFNRMSAPGTFNVVENTPAPTATPTPSPTMEQTLENVDAVVTPTPTPTLTPHPMLDLYTQTELTYDEYIAMQEQNANIEDYTNVLLVGVDRRGGDGFSHADTMMIGTIDGVNERLKLTSLLRDMYVTIPNEGRGRLNSAAAKGGMTLLMQTINENFNMDIKKYVLVDFKIFEDIVDLMGGITVNMSSAEISAANDNIAGLNKQYGVSYLWDGFIFANPGDVLLTGKQALGFARIRKIDSDFVRTTRQFEVIEAIFAKFRTMNITEQYALMYELLPLVETNMDAALIIESAIAALSMQSGGILHATLPVEGLYKSGSVNGSSVLLCDFPAHSQYLHDFIYTSSEVPDEAIVKTPGPSLPPRTPSPTLPPYTGGGTSGGYYISINGEFFYVEGTPSHSGDPIPNVAATPVPTPLPEPTPTPLPTDGFIVPPDTDGFIPPP